MIKPTPEWAFIFTKFATSVVSTWPPNPNASRKEMIIFEIKWWIFWINSLLLNIPLLYGAYCDRRDILTFTKSICYATSCLQITMKMLICKMLQRRMQSVLDELESHVRDAEPSEREIFLRYIKKFGLFYVGYLFYGLGAVIAILMGPLVLPQTLPSDAKYPFPVDTHPVLEIIYIQQSTVGIGIFFMGGIDVQMALMIWCIAIRMEILQTKMRRIQNANEFAICIKKHQYLLSLATEVAAIVRYVLLATIIMTTMANITGGVHIVGNEPILIRMQFFAVVFTSTLLLFMNAWPSENLMRSCIGIGTALYESEWVDGKVDRSIIFVMQRSEKPIVISLAGLLPIISLSYYATYLSKTCSFFTTLRVMLAKMET